MINPQELRIGNYVQFMGETKTVLCIDSEYDAPNKNYKGSVIIPMSVPKGSVRHVQCIDLNPIPITPEILDTINEFFVDNMNYNPDKNNYSTCVDEDTYLHINGKTGETRIGGCEHFAEVEFGTVSNTFFIPDTKYLQQLQNLIYSLSGQELTFKTTTHEQK